MGFFSRKSSKVSVDGISNSGSASIQSPRKTPASASFGSLRLPNVTIAKAPNPSVDPVAYLKSIFAVRERSQLVFAKAKRNSLLHFDVDMSKFADTATYVVSIIKVQTR